MQKLVVIELKETSVARSTTKAEFRPVASTTVEVPWLNSFILELIVHIQQPLSIYRDSLGATSYSANIVFHSRMKHQALAFYFVREKNSTRSS